MKYYRVKKFANGYEVFTTSLNRKVSKHGYYSYLSKYELLTESEFRKVCLSGKASHWMFDEINVDRKKVVKHSSDRRYYFGN